MIDRASQQMLLAMMEADREALCGLKGRHREGRRAWRGGSTLEPGDLGGQIELPRLRIRSPEGEVASASFQWASCTDVLDAPMMVAEAAGVSTRDYPQTLDPAPEAMGEHAAPRSSTPNGTSPSWGFPGGAARGGPEYSNFIHPVGRWSGGYSHGSAEIKAGYRRGMCAVGIFALDARSILSD